MREREPRFKPRPCASAPPQAAAAPARPSVCLPCLPRQKRSARLGGQLRELYFPDYLPDEQPLAVQAFIGAVPAPGGSSGEELSEYELKRKRQIAENEATKWRVPRVSSVKFLSVRCKC
jgi:hypothetical protein